MRKAVREQGLRGFVSKSLGGLRTSVTTRLTLSFLLVIIMTSTIFTVAGIRLIGDRIVAEAQETVKRDLNSAREIYAGRLRQINDVVRLTADRYIIITALRSENVEDAAVELLRIKEKENLDVLTVTDTNGTVLIRANNWDLAGDDQGGDELVAAVLRDRIPAAGTSIVSEEELLKESLLLAKQAHFKFIDTPMARARNETEQGESVPLHRTKYDEHRHGQYRNGHKTEKGLTGQVNGESNGYKSYGISEDG